MHHWTVGRKTRTSGVERERESQSQAAAVLRPGVWMVAVPLLIFEAILILIRRTAVRSKAAGFVWIDRIMKAVVSWNFDFPF